MSLIALTDRLRGAQSAARMLLLLVALTGAVIVGLLGMHSLNTHAAAETGQHTSMAADSVAMGTGSHDVATAAVDDAGADCGSDHSSMFAMACVLALLTTVLLLARPQDVHQSFTLPPRQGSPVVSPPGIPGLRPPSLTALCISRT